MEKAKKRRKSIKRTIKKRQSTGAETTGAESIIDQFLDPDTNQTLYRVRWHKTWEPEENVAGCSALNKFKGNSHSDSDSSDENSVSIYSTGSQMWDVHKIVDSHMYNGKFQYLVMWQDTWLTAHQLNKPALLRKFNSEKRRTLNVLASENTPGESTAKEPIDESANKIDSTSNKTRASKRKRPSDVTKAKDDDDNSENTPEERTATEELIDENATKVGSTSDKTPASKRKRPSDGTDAEDDDGRVDTSMVELTNPRVQLFINRNTVEAKPIPWIEDGVDVKQILGVGMGEDEMMFQVERENGERALMPKQKIYLMHPEKVLHFYEKHLVFLSNSVY